MNHNRLNEGSAWEGVKKMSSNKPTNPKDAVGITKVSISTVPMPALLGCALAMTQGALKYGKHNYRKAGVRTSVYVDAIFRHLASYWEGEDMDQESGLSHLYHIMACCAILDDGVQQQNLNDDRPPMTKRGWMKDFNSKTIELIKRYPNPVPPITLKG